MPSIRETAIPPSPEGDGGIAAFLWVKARYFQNDGYWTFRGGKSQLVRLDATPIPRYQKAKGKRSPYDPSQRTYWEERNKVQVARKTYSKQRSLLIQLDMLNFELYGAHFKVGETIQIDHNISKYRGGSDDLANKRLVHPWCHIRHHRRTGYKEPRLEPDEG